MALDLIRNAEGDVLGVVALEMETGEVMILEAKVTVLRDANRMLEKRLADFLRIGRENDALSMKMQGLAHALLGERDPARLPRGLRRQQAHRGPRRRRPRGLMVPAGRGRMPGPRCGGWPASWAWT